MADLGADKIRQMLVEKYLTEYFYVIPDVANIEARMQSNSTLARMSTPDVFRQWQELEGELILKLAEEGAFRTVRLVDKIYKPVASDYWRVPNIWRRAKTPPPYSGLVSPLLADKWIKNYEAIVPCLLLHRHGVFHTGTC